ncbi:MAG TPA: 50S ribosomal protein L18 [Patescibacteria group bacterium]|nr:50S ribosomal protein L18 [Patescibacteria group bacterium]
MNPEHKKYIRIRRVRRAARTRAKLHGSAAIPRLSVFRSLHYTWTQVIDDDSGKTLVAVTTRGLKTKGTKVEQAAEIGKQLAELCKKAGITKVVFDRGSAKYHGRVKAFAETARTGGLQF